VSDFIFDQSFKSLIPQQAQAGQEFLAAFKYGKSMVFKRYMLGPLTLPMEMLDRKYKASLAVVHGWAKRLINAPLRHPLVGLRAPRRPKTRRRSDIHLRTI
jgi:hypothetical protein